jgi:non-lysosomal glucosylceramidase
MENIIKTKSWPVLKNYDSDHLARLALPLGGIGTGTVSLGGRGDLRDWEIMNRPAKGFTPTNAISHAQPAFILNVQSSGEKPVTRLLEGPLETYLYEGATGSPAANHGLPRFRQVLFGAAYPLGQVFLSDPDVPVSVRLEAFNPLVPADADASGIPLVMLRYVLTNRTDQNLSAAVCGSLPNFIGIDGSKRTEQWGGYMLPTGASDNHNEFRQGKSVQGLYFSSKGVCKNNLAWGTIALTTTEREGVSYRTSWATPSGKWGDNLLSFWDDFNEDGMLTELGLWEGDTPVGSLAVKVEIPANASRSITFLLTWHFPNRATWTPRDVPCECENENCCKNGNCSEDCCCGENNIGNYYTTLYTDAWDVAEKTAPRLAELEEKTLTFVNAFSDSHLPEVVREAALFNLTGLRSQTSFRTKDGHFYGWEGCHDNQGCCHGSCTHVWNYEQATAFLFGDLSRSMREVEFGHSTQPDGLMAFRTSLPFARIPDWLFAAADGQMGTIMKIYRDWQLSGDDDFLRLLWPQVKAALSFAWRPGGWDADQDGVMEGCQHNTMDVEYYGPNPQMESWYLGALRAAELMARHLGDDEFAVRCRSLFQRGREWTDTNLFNGEYYEHQVRPPGTWEDVADGLRLTMGAQDMEKPEYQLGPGCLVDQLVGQYMAHICGLGYLLDPGHVKLTLQSILKYNYKENFSDHFNCLRSFVLGDESALLMASYPKGRPEIPFPYFTEVMTGFEYTAAVGMIYEGQVEEGLKCIRSIRERYDGLKRSPFDEAECGHHYARAMASWAAVLALSGFEYSAVDQVMTFAANKGRWFWSTGNAWGTVVLCKDEEGWVTDLHVLGGTLSLRRINLRGIGSAGLTQMEFKAGDSFCMIRITVNG